MTPPKASRVFVSLLVVLPMFGVATSRLNAAEPQCQQSGTTVTCTGAVGSVTFTAPTVQTLDVSSLTAIATWVSLTGTGAAPGSGGDAHYTCIPNPTDCNITLGVNAPDTCTVKAGAPAGTQCVSTGPATAGPSGNAGPNVTITVDTGAFAVLPGTNTAAVYGRSQGSKGGNGGDTYVFGTAGSGAPGANGGQVTVSVTGTVLPGQGLTGIIASSVAGNGGNGGDAYVIGGSAGAGGSAGFGGDATVNFGGGLVFTTGDGAVGVAAFSQGGNGGSGGGGGGLVYSGGAGAGAGQAGAAQVFTGAGTSIYTFGGHAYGILGQSLGGGGGSGSGGFGLFYSGGGGGSTGGAGGSVTVDANGAIYTYGESAHGILAQSIGGGGGNAGSVAGFVALGGSGAGGGAGGTVSVANSGAIATYGLRANAIEVQSIGGGGGNGASSGGAVSLGGNGAGTTTGGAVTVSNSGTLATTGAHAAGILAQSIGGGGGNGGTSGGIFSAGGNGGAGAHGGTVIVYNSGNISAGIAGALSMNSAGIIAQSIGGGGGNGGGAISVDVTGTGASAAFGGSAGVGGNGAQVQIKLDQVDPALATAYTIETYGPLSHAVLAQSIGGGGGNGGFAVSASFIVALGVAAAGGPGGAGGQVDVATKGFLTTHADDSIGILAQSIGGGGGNGGFAMTGGLTASVSVGGGGGLGGGASAVNVSSSSQITTMGANSHGILAQSIGGGGGNGGFAGAAAPTVSVGIGGSGGSGGAGSQVTLSNVGNISTAGDNSIGIAAQSIGGGGGNGGFAAALGVGAASVAVGVGGTGASGGTAGNVSVQNAALITTVGHNSPGIFGQSIGGGGGNGGFALSLAGGAALGVAVGVGGSGSKGSQAGTVDVVSTGPGVTTTGDHSSAIRAQSIGGGGGNGGFSVGIAASATVSGAGAAGAVSVGGAGGLAGNAAAVNVNSSGVISTQGAFSHGIEAQSIGGGGGNGGFSIAGAFTLGQGAAGVAVGGSGNGGGKSDLVTVASYGAGYWVNSGPSSSAFGTVTLQTTGAQSNGILAQSLGGGGGNGGFSGALGVSLQGAGGGVAVGGRGDKGGNSEVVNVTSYHNIVTIGEKSDGILAQSIGGGGGNGGFSIGLGGGSKIAGSVGVGGAGKGGGNAEDVFVRSYGTIATQGLESHGVAAQSIGGGGGNGGFSIAGSFSTGPAALGVGVGGTGSGGGTGFDVFVDSYAAAVNGSAILIPPSPAIATLTTTGDRSNGILAQSIGGGGGNGGFSVGAGGATGPVGIGVSVGGLGAGGGAAGNVLVNSVHNIVTGGDFSNGIAAQSLGGGGGNGGFSLGLGGGAKFGGAISVGGFATGGGGGAGFVTINAKGTIATDGTDAHGILAQAIGGSGGSGGAALSGALGVESSGAAISVGGGGSNGGLGGAVAVNSNVGVAPGNQWTIQTLGSGHGIFAQSIGGGGGAGGLAGSLTAVGSAKVALSISVGGFGGPGNAASTVNVASNDNIFTAAEGSMGILAQSIGGGGGAGGMALAGSLVIPTGNELNLAVGFGGFGGTGANAGTVTVNAAGSIRTVGDFADGIGAQSLGGGGGNGRLSVAATINACTTCPSNVPSIAAGIGGKGGAGGAGADVHLTNAGAVITLGEEAAGLRAQSIGGGGGNGGITIAGSISGGESKQFAGTVGGFGGSGSYAGNVTVTNTGDITTGSETMVSIQLPIVGEVFLPMISRTGRASHGIVAQSIGGGGGAGGLAISGAIGLLGTTSNVNVGVAVGGFGGSSGTAGSATVSNTGVITTLGHAAHGIFAQSIGGGGGSGGNSITGLLGAGNPTAKTGRAVNVSVAVGGRGGDGNVAGNVTVNQSGSIATSGNGSNGILAQSIGGGGGTAGDANSISLLLGTKCTFDPFGLVSKKFKSCASPPDKSKAGVSVEVAVGGFGGIGNDASTVTVTNNGVITTTGLASAGIKAQSIGGGGGSAGNGATGTDGLAPGIFDDGLGFLLTVAGSALGTGGTKESVGVVTIGGSGGASGNGSAVDVINRGLITTYGFGADGIHAQSIGGGGGDGGKASSGMLGAFSLGGFGGASGNGGAVSVTNETGGWIYTFGDLAHAVFAQSVGGGGGDGGSATAILAIGGSASASGDGGIVTIQNDATINTAGDFAVGLFGQSVGGGGGGHTAIGGGTGISIIGIGGSGGASGNGDLVTIHNVGAIVTLGVGADAIRGQSIGGGGGTSSDNAGGDVIGLAVSIGGKGGGAGNGGGVVIANANLLRTTGDQADGIFAQSVGGGGGDGGRAIGVVGVGGGSGGASGHGGDVNVTNEASGLIWTAGTLANGIFAQSIGGGGGAGGGSFAITPAQFALVVGASGTGGGQGGRVSVTNRGGIQTDGESSQGIFAQSVGGGGGAGALAGFVSLGIAANPTIVGGSGGGGAGGAVTVTNEATGRIVTNGADSTAIFAQSVGGGGGTAGLGFSVGLGAPIPVLLGGTGGAGGAGGAVSVVNRGGITINGDNSVAILAQSIGGGGGTTRLPSGVLGIPLTIGGANGVLGNGGSVDVFNLGSITIAGNNSIGIFAQSVGGGGGLVKPGGGATSVIANTGGIGNGGLLNITNTAGSIIVTGDNSVALYSQSVGGGGGVVGTMYSGSAGGQGAASAATLHQTGHLIATGLNSSALVIQSQGPGGNGDITIDILNASPNQPSTIAGGTGTGVGILIMDGARNLLNNAGFITTMRGLDGFAVRAGSGDDSIVNTGRVLGSIDLGGGANSFFNKEASEFMAGATVNLGGGTLTNEGLFSPGGLNRVQMTTLTGNLVQAAAGTFDVDLDIRLRTADRVDATGTATMAGRVVVNVVDLVASAIAARPGTFDLPIVSAAQGSTGMAGSLTAPNTAVAGYSLVSPNPTSLVLRSVIDFSPEGLSSNAAAIGNAINAIQAAQTSPAFAPLAAALFFQPDVATLGTTYDSLAGAASAGSQQASIAAADRFVSAVASQTAFWLGNQVGAANGFTAATNRAFDNSAPRGSAMTSSSGSAQPWRLWVTGYDGRSELPGRLEVGAVATTSEGRGVLLGFDYQVTPRTLVGVAGGRGTERFDASIAETHGTMTGGHVAVYGAHRRRAFYAAGNLVMSLFSNDLSRHAIVPGTRVPVPNGAIFSTGEEFLAGSFDSRSVAGAIEAGYRRPFGMFELTPFAGTEFAVLREDAYVETVGAGASLLGLAREARTTTSLPAFAGVQLKAEGDWGGGKVLSAWVRGAWRHELRPERTTESWFITAPGFPFVVHGAEPVPDAMRTSLGLRQAIGRGVSFFAQLDADFARSRRTYAAQAGIRGGW